MIWWYNVDTHSGANFTRNVLMNHFTSRSEIMVHYQNLYQVKTDRRTIFRHFTWTPGSHRSLFLVAKSIILSIKVIIECNKMIWYVYKKNHFWVLGKPQVEKKGKNGMSFVVPSSIVQYKLRQGILFRVWRNILKCALDEVAFWEDFLFLTFNIIFC